jgi:hypothetical protein
MKYQKYASVWKKGKKKKDAYAFLCIKIARSAPGFSKTPFSSVR